MKRFILVVNIVLLLSLIVVGCCALPTREVVVTATPVPPTPTSYPTHTPYPTPTRVPPTPTPTAPLGVEATPTPTLPPATPTPVLPTPPPSPTPTATPWPQMDLLLYSDDFSDPLSGWTISSDEVRERGYSDGEYYVLVKKTNWVSWGRAHRKFTDFRLEVDARKVAGPDHNYFGVIVRRRDEDNYYMFQISSDGRYRVRKQVNDEWETLVAWTTSPHINQGQSSNHLTLIAQGPNFSFYVNGEHLVDVVDTSFAEGDIGLLAGAFDEVGVRIHFDNLEVWSPTS